MTDRADRQGKSILKDLLVVMREIAIEQDKAVTATGG
jgi:hypothetical protein